MDAKTNEELADLVRLQIVKINVLERALADMQSRMGGMMLDAPAVPAQTGMPAVTVNSERFRQLLYFWSRSSSDENVDRTMVALVAHIDAHTAQAVAQETVKYKADARTLYRRQLEDGNTIERFKGQLADALEGQITELGYGGALYQPQAWPDAWHALRDDVLSGVDGLDNDQVNTVLGMLDNYEPEITATAPQQHAQAALSDDQIGEAVQRGYSNNDGIRMDFFDLQHVIKEVRALLAASQQPAAAPTKRPMPLRDKALCSDGSEPDWAAHAAAEAAPATHPQEVAAMDVRAVLAEMVIMMDSGDEHGEGSDWHRRATAALAAPAAQVAVPEESMPLPDMLWDAEDHEDGPRGDGAADFARNYGENLMPGDEVEVTVLCATRAHNRRMLISVVRDEDDWLKWHWLDNPLPPDVAPSPAQPAPVADASPVGAKPQHSDDAAVDRFAAAMKHKLAVSRDKGRTGWDDESQCTMGTLANMLVEHIAKGDQVDIANFAMMLHQREAATFEHNPCYGGDAKRVIISAWKAVQPSSAQGDALSQKGIGHE